METASIELWHGSSHVIKHPEYGLVKPNNDYGRGFYCTRSVELAKEMCIQNPIVKGQYGEASNPILEVFYLEDAHGAISDFSGNPPFAF